MEHLHRGLELVVGEGHHVGVGAVAEDHGLFLQCAFQRPDVVAQPGGPLEVEVGSGGVHLVFQVAGEPVGPSGQKVAEVGDDLAVLLGTDPADARRRALVDVAQQAGPADLVVPLEHSPSGSGPGRPW